MKYDAIIIGGGKRFGRWSIEGRWETGLRSFQTEIEEGGVRLRTITGDGSGIISAQWNHDETQIMLTTVAGHIYRYHTRMAELLTAACTRALPARLPPAIIWS